MLKSSLVVLSAFFTLLSLNSHAEIAQGRAGTWEFGLNATYFDSLALTGERGSEIDIDGETGFGFTGGYNFGEHWALMFDFTWSTPDYEATIVSEDGSESSTIRTEMDIANFQFKGVYHFLPGTVTPFIELGGGWTWVDSNVIEGPAFTGCWWDPWWGFVCQRYYDTYSDTRGSYSGALGLRWDITPGFGLKMSVGRLEIDTPDDVDSASIDMARLEFNWRSFGGSL